jgi:glycosyltransferase involved in cell wall biosynthesis
MNTPPPPVCVLMAVHNGEKYLRPAVDSILSQTFKDFIFLIIDDGSTDGSPQILKQYASIDSRIQLITQPNAGLTRTLNIGLKTATSEFIARMDSDDIALPTRLESQVAFLREHPEISLVGSNVEFIDPQGCPINPKPGLLVDHEQIDADLLRKGWPVVHPAIMMRRNAAMQIGGYDETYITNQDHDLFLRLAEHGRLANLPQVLLKYRQHFDSISLAKFTQQGDTVEAIVRAAYQRRGLAAPDALLKQRPKPMSRLDHHRAWCWAALSAGNIQTARKHAMAALRLSPFSQDSWRMVYSALRGR